jgi:hypothetical protein
MMALVSYWIASQNVDSYLPPRVLGQEVADSPQIEPRYPVHAVGEGAETTICGLPIGPLHAFRRRRFEVLHPDLRCQKCDHVADHPQL